MTNELKYKSISIAWLGHSTVLIHGHGYTIYIDPWHLPTEGSLPVADAVLVTHDHPTHLSMHDIRSVIDDHTVLVTPHQATVDISEGRSLDYLLVKELVQIYPGETLNIDNMKVYTVPAYNLATDTQTNQPVHDPDSQFVGYLVEIAGIRIYHAGDTDNLPALQDVTNIDIALVPVSGESVMGPEMAASLVNALEPHFAIPIHWGDIYGSEDDARKFRSLAKVAVAVLHPPSWAVKTGEPER